MAFTDLSKLGSIEPLNLSFQNLTNAKTATNELVTTATTQIGALWFNLPIFVIFLVLIFILYKEDGPFNYDVTRSVFLSSGLCLFLSIAFILSGLVNSIIAIVWFATIFTITFIAILKLKEKNL